MKQSMLEVAFGSGLRVVRRHLVVDRFLILLMTQESESCGPVRKGEKPCVDGLLGYLPQPLPPEINFKVT